MGKIQDMSPKVFIIDAQADYRSLLSHHVTTHWPDATVKEYDPVTSGRLPESFSGAGNDIILLGEPAGDADALGWLRQWDDVSPTILNPGSTTPRTIA